MSTNKQSCQFSIIKVATKKYVPEVKYSRVASTIIELGSIFHELQVLNLNRVIYLVRSKCHSEQCLN